MFNNEKQRLMSQLKEKEKTIQHALKDMNKSEEVMELLQYLNERQANLQAVTPKADLSRLLEERRVKVGLYLKRQDVIIDLISKTWNSARTDLERTTAESIADIQKASSYGDYLAKYALMCQTAKSIVEKFGRDIDAQRPGIQEHMQAWENLINELSTTKTFVEQTALPELKRRKQFECKMEVFNSGYKKLLEVERSTRCVFNENFQSRVELDKMPRCFIDLLQKTKAPTIPSGVNDLKEVKLRVLKTPAEMSQHYSGASKTPLVSVIKRKINHLTDDLKTAKAGLEKEQSIKKKIDDERESLTKEIKENATATEEFGRKIDLEKAEAAQLREEIQRLNTTIQNQSILKADSQKERENLEAKVVAESEMHPIIEREMSSKVSSQNTEIKAGAQSLEAKEKRLAVLQAECAELEKIVPEFESLIKENIQKEAEYQQLDAEINRLRDINENLKKQIQEKSATGKKEKSATGKKK